MALHADAMDGHTLVQHLLHHVIDAIALSRVTLVIVIIEQQCVGVGLMGIFESLGDKLVATQLVVARLTIRIARLPLAVHHTSAGIVADGFVHHVPAVYHVLIAVHHRMDMFAQTLVENLLLDGTSFLVLKHPVGKLRVPAQAVSAQLDAVLTAEIGNLVCLLKIPDALLGMEHTGFHVVLSSDAVKLTQCQRLLVLIGHITLVQGDAYHKIVLIGIFQSVCIAVDS